jgi:hypothetical protein
MNNYSQIYWLTRLDNIQVLFHTGCFISLLVICFYYLSISLFIHNKDDVKDFKIKNSKYKNISFFTVVISGLFLVFMPTKNDMILIYAGGKTMDYVQSDTSLSKIPYQTTRIISEYLDKSIEQLKENK